MGFKHFLSDDFHFLYDFKFLLATLQRQHPAILLTLQSQHPAILLRVASTMPAVVDVDDVGPSPFEGFRTRAKPASLPVFVIPVTGLRFILRSASGPTFMMKVKQDS